MVLLWDILGRKIVQYIGFALIAMTAIFSIRRAGQTAERMKALQENATAMEKRHDVEKTIDKLPDNVVQQQLYKKWARD